MEYFKTNFFTPFFVQTFFEHFSTPLYRADFESWIEEGLIK